MRRLKDNDRYIIRTVGDRIPRLQYRGPDALRPYAAVITSDSDTISVSVAAEESELSAGLTATDDKDEILRIPSGSLPCRTLQSRERRTISYVVFDSANQAATLTRNLEYTDYVSPKIHQTQPLRFSLNEWTKSAWQKHDS